MRIVPVKSAEIDEIWKSGTYIGDRRPVTRATVSRCTLKEYPLGKRTYRSFLDGFEKDTSGANVERELPNLLTCTINRGLTDDAATCSLELRNTRPLAVGQLPANAIDVDQEGWYTFNRGMSPTYSERWGYDENDWRDWLIPDRVIRTYQGYGTKPGTIPRDDSKLLLTGIWLIESVKYTAGLSIAVECRDMAALLLDQKFMPPVVPKEAYPANYTTRHRVEKTGKRTVTVPGFGGTKLTGISTTNYTDSSNKYWDSNGIVNGHMATHSLDGKSSTYWMSIGNGRPDASWSYEWIQFDTRNQQVGGVKFLPWGGSYEVYVGVYKDGKWLGDKVVPYAPDHVGAPNDSDRPYVKRDTCGRDTWTSINLPETYKGVDKVRLTFTNLYDSDYGRHQYRAGLREMQVYNGPVWTDAHTITESYKYYVTEGNISDYCVDEETEILTGKGWKDYRSLRVGDTVLTLNMGTGLSEWQPVEDVYVRHRTDRSMVQITATDSRFNALATPDHRWPMLDQQGEIVRRTSETLATDDRFIIGGRNPIDDTEVRTTETVGSMIRTLVTYTGVVWCPTVKNKTFFARRNGVVFYTSNTDICKDILAIAGFYTTDPGRVAILGGADTDLQVHPVTGAVWGDFESAGTAPPVGMAQEKLDKQPLIDAINYCKEVLGFNFFVDETGGAVFRSPNLWEVGCYTSHGAPGSKPRSIDVLQLDENIQLIDYSVTLDAANKRKRVTVGTADAGKYLAVVDGKEYIRDGEYPFGMERNAIWLDQNFKSQLECTVMADMIKVRQMFAYRRGSITVPANPNLQIDDQVMIYERRTGESYLHYITSIQSSWQAADGGYQMTLETHWLGEHPSWTQFPGTSEGTLWVFDLEDLSQDTIDFLIATGRLGNYAGGRQAIGPFQINPGRSPV